ncbi:MAG: hypothetical protein E7356_03030 [Clostridiales bacterium]|nr:hypothetical protein [Clostridiales bacterium]
MNEKVKQMVEEYKEYSKKALQTSINISKKQEEFDKEMYKLEKQLKQEQGRVDYLKRQLIYVGLEEVVEELKHHPFVQNLGKMQVSCWLRMSYGSKSSGQIVLLEEQLEKIKKYLLAEDFDFDLTISFSDTNKTVKVGLFSFAHTIQKDGKSLVEHVKIQPFENRKEYGWYCIDDYSQIIVQHHLGEIFGDNTKRVPKVWRDCVRAVLEKENTNSDELDATNTVMGE